MHFSNKGSPQYPQQEGWSSIKIFYAMPCAVYFNNKSLRRKINYPIRENYLFSYLINKSNYLIILSEKMKRNLRINFFLLLDDAHRVILQDSMYDNISKSDYINAIFVEVIDLQYHLVILDVLLTNCRS